MAACGKDRGSRQKRQGQFLRRVIGRALVRDERRETGTAADLGIDDGLSEASVHSIHPRRYDIPSAQPAAEIAPGSTIASSSCTFPEPPRWSGPRSVRILKRDIDSPEPIGGPFRERSRSLGSCRDVGMTFRSFNPTVSSPTWDLAMCGRALLRRIDGDAPSGNLHTVRQDRCLQYRTPNREE